MDIARFEQLVTKAVDSLPEEFLDRLDNVEILVQEQPSADQLRQSGTGRGYTLLGLYEGIPITERSQGYSLVAPDKISIFRRPIIDKCRQENTDIAAEIEAVVRHEIAHHFGISDERLDELERERNARG
jgi:predicted Zn-dependent protease with MMP-like domain